MAAISGKTVQNVFLSQHCQRNRELDTRYHKDRCVLSMHSSHPLQGWKVACAGMPAMQLHSLTASQNSLGNRASVFCNAAQCTSALPSFKKVDFLKLQNGSDIRGVAVAGVDGEPVNLTEPVSEAIAAAFASWLLDRKKPDGSRRLRVSIGHDSRISAKTLQDAVSRGIAAAGLEVIQYGLASTPAMFNSTITEDENFLCPTDGSIMITASHLPYNRNGFKFFTNTGGLGKADITDILEQAASIYQKFPAESLKESEQAATKFVEKVDYMTIYTSTLVKAVRKAAGNIEKPLEGFHIIVDAGNGAGGFFAVKLFSSLGQ